MKKPAKQKLFTPREFAIYRNVWDLTEEERNQLDEFFMLRCPGSQLDKKLIEPSSDFTSWKLQHNKYVMYLDFLKPSTVEQLLESNASLLLSCRISYINKFQWCLVREDTYQNNYTKSRPLLEGTSCHE
jgi:hypothetical protein